MRTLVVLVAALASVSACVRRPAPATAVADTWPQTLAAADADAAGGCYRCLERALATYEAGLSRGAGTGPQAYRTAVHLAVRERLLGLYPGPYQEAPARLAAHGAPDDVAAGSEVLPAIVWRRGALGVGMGLPAVTEDLTQWRARRRLLEAVADTDAWSATLLLAMIGTNFAVGFDEGQTPFRGPLPGLDRETWWRRHPDDPSLSFARLTLLRSSIDDLTAFHTAHPSFEEIDGILGEAELARGRLVSADEAFARALAAFPSLAPALALRGDLRQRMEDFETALTLYDTLLARLPEHREALLGRLKSLGFLGRHADAIDAADRMLTLGTWYIGEAYYWKAWNLFNLRRLDDARAEVDHARTLMVNADVDYLGGVIAFRQNRRDDAQRDFDSAVQLESRHCEALFDRAALRLVQQDWAPASAGFDEAFACHEERTATFERRIADAREARVSAEARAALVARREQALRDHRHQLAWARYNAAVAYANIGKPDVTKSRVDEVMAIGGPAADAARDLLAQLRIK